MGTKPHLKKGATKKKKLCIIINGWSKGNTNKQNKMNNSANKWKQIKDESVNEWKDENIKVSMKNEKIKLWKCEWIN